MAEVERRGTVAGNDLLVVRGHATAHRYRQGDPAGSKGGSSSGPGCIGHTGSIGRQPGWRRSRIAVGADAWW